MSLLLERRLAPMSHAATVVLPLHRLAHGRTGDKGNRSNISVIAYRPEHFELLVEQVTEARVAQVLAHRRPGRVTRFILPRLHAMNFVIDDVLDGGVNSSLNLDTHGKALAFLLLDMAIETPVGLLEKYPAHVSQAHNDKTEER
jgi:hypothetical protein